MANLPSCTQCKGGQSTAELGSTACDVTWRELISATTQVHDSL